jgi:hypothetical protein
MCFCYRQHVGVHGVLSIGSMVDSERPKKMTDEERQKLCAALRNTSDDWLPERLRTDVRDIAADEIERLAKELLITKGALGICQGELNLAFDRMQK